MSFVIPRASPVKRTTRTTPSATPITLIKVRNGRTRRFANTSSSIGQLGVVTKDFVNIIEILCCFHVDKKIFVLLEMFVYFVVRRKQPIGRSFTCILASCRKCGCDLLLAQFRIVYDLADS